MDAIAQESPHYKKKEQEGTTYLWISSMHKVFSTLPANHKRGAECSTAVY